MHACVSSVLFLLRCQVLYYTILIPLSNSTLMDLLYATEDPSLCMRHLYPLPWSARITFAPVLFGASHSTCNQSLAFSRSELDSEGSIVSTSTEHHFEEF